MHPTQCVCEACSVMTFMQQVFARGHGMHRRLKAALRSQQASKTESVAESFAADGSPEVLSYRMLEQTIPPLRVVVQGANNWSVLSYSIHAAFINPRIDHRIELVEYGYILDNVLFLLNTATYSIIVSNNWTTRYMLLHKSPLQWRDVTDITAQRTAQCLAALLKQHAAPHYYFVPHFPDFNRFSSTKWIVLPLFCGSCGCLVMPSLHSMSCRTAVKRQGNQLFQEAYHGRISLVQRLVPLLFCGSSGCLWMPFHLFSSTAGEETIFWKPCLYRSGSQEVLLFTNTYSVLMRLFSFVAFINFRGPGTLLTEGVY